jgi:hypothetical protein
MPMRLDPGSTLKIQKGEVIAEKVGGSKEEIKQERVIGCRLML